MVILTGPRQVGKTWLAKKVAERYQKPIYLNYDRFEDREMIRTESWPDATDLLIFDEIHKMEGWKNYVKGIFDTKPDSMHILVTGSSRFETVRQSGDSMAGRFFRHRLLPLSYREVTEKTPATLEKLISRGGFPEPYSAQNSVDADRWRLQYIDGLIRTDILDFEHVHDLRAIQMVLELLRRRVGSPVSCKAIAEDVQISPSTVNRYIGILESLYIVFRITPYSHNIARSLLKEPKIYFFDNGLVIGNEAARFENMVAVSLLKHVCGLSDYQGKQIELRYIRTKDGDEVDFCLVEQNSPLQIIEVKAGGTDIGSAIKKIQSKYGFPAVAVIKNLKRDFKADTIPVVKAEHYLNELFL